MINFTPIARKHFVARLYEQLRYKDYADAVQQGELVKLIEHASLTEFGRAHKFSKMRTYREFATEVPLHRYEDLKPQIMRMVAGEGDVLWRGKCFNFAQSSGTTDGKSKYIPITAESLKRNHYQGASDVVSHYLNLNPASRLFSGKAFILGGSFANQLDLKPGTRVGDLSATLIQHINPLANLFRVPSKRIALMEDWSEKLPALVSAAIGENITNLSGVPSWFLTVLKEVLAKAGVDCIHEVWPNLEVFATCAKCTSSTPTMPAKDFLLRKVRGTPPPCSCCSTSACSTSLSRFRKLIVARRMWYPLGKWRQAKPTSW